MATLVALLLRCGVVANADVLAAIVAVESGGNPLALGVNGGFELVRQPRDPGEAVAMARWLTDRGHSFDAGLAQVNSANLTRLGLDVASVFDTCANLRAASRILGECHERAGQRWRDPQRRLAGALSCYNTGDLTRGISNGYVHAVLAAGAPFLSRDLHRVGADGATALREEALHHAIPVAGPGRRTSAVLAGVDAFAAPTGTSARGERRPRHPEEEWNGRVSGDPGGVRFGWWLTSDARGDLPSLCTSQPARSCSA